MKNRLIGFSLIVILTLLLCLTVYSAEEGAGECIKKVGDLECPDNGKPDYYDCLQCCIRKNASGIYEKYFSQKTGMIIQGKAYASISGNKFDCDETTDNKIPLGLDSTSGMSACRSTHVANPLMLAIYNREITVGNITSNNFLGSLERPLYCDDSGGFEGISRNGKSATVVYCTKDGEGASQCNDTCPVDDTCDARNTDCDSRIDNDIPGCIPINKIQNLGKFPVGTIFKLQLNRADDYLFAFYDGVNMVSAPNCAGTIFQFPRLSCPAICGGHGACTTVSKIIEKEPVRGPHSFKLTLFDSVSWGCNADAIIFAKRPDTQDFVQIGSFIMDQSTPGNACMPSAGYWEYMRMDQRNVNKLDSSTFNFSIDYGCLGSIPNAELIPGDDSGLTNNMGLMLVGSNTPRQCEAKCNPGFVKRGESCFPETQSCPVITCNGINIDPPGIERQRCLVQSAYDILSPCGWNNKGGTCSWQMGMGTIKAGSVFCKRNEDNECKAYSNFIDRCCTTCGKSGEGQPEAAECNSTSVILKPCGSWRVLRYFTGRNPSEDALCPEEKCARFNCIGSIDGNAIIIPGDDKDLVEDTPNILVDNNTQRKCEWNCKTGFVYSAQKNKCVPNTYGVCGNRVGNYLNTETAWPDPSNYCASGNNSSAPNFPGLNSKVDWNCTPTTQPYPQDQVEHCTATRGTLKICIGPISEYATMYPGDGSDLSQDTLNILTPRNMNTGRKCEWYCNDGYEKGPPNTPDENKCLPAIEINCYGEIDPNAEIYPNDGPFLVPRTKNTLVDSDTDNYCEWHCKETYHREGTTCVKNSGGYSCKGNTPINALLCEPQISEENNLDKNYSRILRDTILNCTDLRKCEYYCGQGTYKDPTPDINKCINQSYTCLENPLIDLTNTSPCPNTTTNLTRNTLNTITPTCSPPYMRKKCEYYCNPGYISIRNIKSVWSGSWIMRRCTGVLIQNAFACNEDLPAGSTPWSIVDSCLNALPCQVQCQEGFTKFGNSCIESIGAPVKPSISSFTGTYLGNNKIQLNFSCTEQIPNVQLKITDQRTGDSIEAPVICNTSAQPIEIENILFKENSILQATLTSPEPCENCTKTIMLTLVSSDTTSQAVPDYSMLSIIAFITITILILTTKKNNN